MLLSILVMYPYLSKAQNISQQNAIYNYQDNGRIDAFLFHEIDSITYSRLDSFGIKHDDIVMQEIWTSGNVYRIPLERVDSIGFRDPNMDRAENLVYDGWTDASVSDIESNLQNSCGEDGTINVNFLASVIETNDNVEETYASNDSLTLIVKYKDSNTYSVYPINRLKDPFDESDDVEEEEASSPRKTVMVSSQYRTTGSNGKVAVFNYFSKQWTRRTQNRMLEYMMQDLNEHDFGVEYYPYDDMTVKNIRYVINHSEDYKAVIVISHGFSKDDKSYFVLGEEYNEKMDYDSDYGLFIADYEVSQSEKIPFSQRFWNEGIGAFGTDARYDIAVNVNKLQLVEDVILYMGACDAYKNKKNMHGTCIGWSGSNSTAQAHVTLLFYNLMRGKSLADAIDIRNEEDPYYDITQGQQDSWDEDPITGAIMEHKFGAYVGEIRLTPAKEYWRNAGYYLLTNPSGYKGPIFQNEKKKAVFTIKMNDMVGASADTYPKRIYVKVTPLKSTESPQTYIFEKDENNNYSQYTEFSLENGAYAITAAQDEAFTNEILFRKPLIFIRSTAFKENGADWEEQTICPDDHHPHMIDLGLPSGTKWACCNLDYDTSKQNPSNIGSCFAWGQTDENTDYLNNNFSDIAGTVYDVAHIKWGGNWVIPNNNQINELFRNCTSEKTSLNGVNGLLLTSSNKQSIFIPDCDYWSSQHHDMVNTAYYWNAGILDKGYVSKSGSPISFKYIRPVSR